MRSIILRSAFIILFLALNSCSTASVKESDFHYKIGVASLSEGNLQSAFVEFQRALQLNPDNKDALVNLGYIHLQFEEFEKAKGLFLRAVRIDPQFSDAYTYLGVTYIKMRQWKEAIDPLKKALSNVLYKNPGQAFYYLGMAYYRTGLFDNAVDAFKDSIKRSPSTPQAYYGLSLAYNKIGRYGDAAAIIERAIGIDPVFNSDKAKFITEKKQSLLTSKGEDETDTRDYLEIMRY